MREIQCKRCFFFTPEWCPKKRDSLDPDLIRDCQYFRIKTNADRIRSMTDEELAEWLSANATNYACHKFSGMGVIEKYGDNGLIAKSWLEWMKQEVKHE